MSKIRNVATCLAFSIMFTFSAAFCEFDAHAVEMLTIGDEMMLPSGFDVLPDGKGNFFITSFDDSKLKTTISFLDLSNTAPSLSLINYDTGEKNINYKYTVANYCSDSVNSLDNCICFTCINADKTIIEKVFIDQNVCYEFLGLPLSGTNINSPLKIAVYNDDLFFFIKDSNAKIVSAYNITYGAMNESSLTYDEKTFHSIFTDISKKYLYALNSSNNLLRYNTASNGYKFEAPEKEIIASSLKFLTDNVFVTSDGKIIMLNKDKFVADSTVKINAEMKDYPKCVAAGFDDTSILVKTGDRMISRIRCTDGLVTGKIELTENVLAIAKSSDKIIAVTAVNGSNKSIALLKESDIVEVTPAEPSKPSDGSGESGDNKAEENPPSDLDEDAITSEVYNIDNENHVITEIDSGTTFTMFKNNLIFNGYSLVLKDDSGKIKSGNSTKVATGYTVSFIRDGAEKVSFKLIVKGDITGTGTLTSRDISAFQNYLLGKTELSENFLKAANINADNEEDTIDLFLMYKLMQR